MLFDPSIKSLDFIFNENESISLVFFFLMLVVDGLEYVLCFFFFLLHPLQVVAQACDRRFDASEELGLLHGLPVAIKENVDVQVREREKRERERERERERRESKIVSVGVLLLSLLIELLTSFHSVLYNSPFLTLFPFFSPPPPPPPRTCISFFQLGL